jgi:hypothetical protein
MYSSDFRQPLSAANFRADRAVNEVFDTIINQFADVQRDSLMDRLVGRVEGWNLREKRISPCPNEARDAEWTKLHDDGLSFGDISRAFAVPRSTVSSAVQRYRQKRTH